MSDAMDWPSLDDADRDQPVQDEDRIVALDDDSFPHQGAGQ